MKKKIAILGSTGSIGTQALEVIDSHPDLFEVSVLTAYNNAELLIRQAFKYVPEVVVSGNEDQYDFVRESLSKLPITVLSGPEGIAAAATHDSTDIVLTAMVGYSGLFPTLQAIKAGKRIALANKETMVVAGELVQSLSKEHGAVIIPVDSEHSAIFQCLAGEEMNLPEKIILTASGGPFREKSMGFLKTATRADALKHPNWCMGDKITIDSASLMNKGLEAIEAKWLFNVEPGQIEVVIHPQSIIHSMVQFADGSVKAQLSLPDMRMPIQYAFTFPDRIKSDFPRLKFEECTNLTFEKPDPEKFRNLAISFEVMKKGGNMPCVMNAANEVAVGAFLNGRIGFLDMPVIIEQVLGKVVYTAKPAYEDYKESDRQARIIANGLIK